MGAIKDILKEKILILDGATGTAIQDYKLDRKDYTYKGRELTSCHEILNITREDIILDVHHRYIEAGADIIETNTFNANNISLKKYEIEDITYDLAYRGAALAVKAAKKSSKKIWVAGSVGPTSKSASIPTKEDPTSREVSFDELLAVYKVQVRGLIDGGVDLILIETIFDGLNAKAAVIAVEEEAATRNINIPIMISATVDRSGRLLSGQDMFSLVRALDRDSIISFGLNCSFGAKDLIPLVEKLGDFTNKNLSIYPNAGLPNEEGEYDEAPATTLEYLKPLIDNKQINIIGGCCGTTPAHINLIADHSCNKAPRKIPSHTEKSFLSGTTILKEKDFFIVGERNNVDGSRKFKRLIDEKKYEEALEISREQIEKGAHIIDVNLDDALLDSPKEMETFLRALGNDAYTSKVPIMIDSSNFDVIEIALKNIPGKAIVNSISLKDGTGEFLKKAALIKKYGAAAVVMAFDEKGQATSFERKIEISKRAYHLLIDSGWSGSDIVFDTNILTIGTGREEDRYHGVDFLKSVKWINENLPGAKTSGGVSNLSFAFRGNNPLRKIIHEIFLRKGREYGLSMGMVNPGERIENIPIDLEKIIVDLIEGKDVVDDILNYKFDSKTAPKKEEIRELSTEERLKSAILKGGSSSFVDDIHTALKTYKPLDIIQNILMGAMTLVGNKFEAGELYLPQIIRSASTMESAVSILTPLMEAEGKGTSSRGKILMATVRGDVHDIGKNITGTVLKCNGYEVIDLGVMVDKNIILEVALKNSVDIVTLSGLISPSLIEMEEVVSLFNENNLNTPILIGGAATSRLHTALKLEPKYKNRVIHVTDASSTLPVVGSLLGTNKDEYITTTVKNYSFISKAYFDKQEKKERIDIIDARNSRKQVNYTPIAPIKDGVTYLEVSLDKLEGLMDWSIFLNALRVKGTSAEESTLKEGRETLKSWIEDKATSKAVYGIYPTSRVKDTVTIEGIQIPLVRNQGNTNESLADYVEQDDYIGAFVASVNVGDNKNIIHCLLANTLAEATSKYLEEYISKTNWKVGLRPAIGYPCLPDHSLKKDIFKLLDGEKTGAKLSDNYAMSPGSTVCGLYLGNLQSEYITPKTILEDQIKLMAIDRGVEVLVLKKYLTVK